MTPDVHLDLDQLADVLAGEPGEQQHLRTCSTCQAALSQLEQALPSVTSALAGLPVPALPADLEQRWLTAPRPRPVTELRPRTGSRWTRPLGVAGGLAAAAALVFGGITLLGNDGSAPGSTRAGSTAGTEAGGPKISSTGADYRKDGNLLARELPALLAGSAMQALAAPEAQPRPSSTTADKSGALTSGSAAVGVAADPLARLRTTAGLAGCITALTDPNDTSLPLALDYALFEGQPALVVVLPSPKAGKVDVFVVGPTCGPADAALLHFARLTKP